MDDAAAVPYSGVTKLVEGDADAFRAIGKVAPSAMRRIPTNRSDDKEV